MEERWRRRAAIHRTARALNGTARVTPGLLVSAWSPDFPTWSGEALSLYEKVHGPQDVDGIIAMDLVVLESLLKLTGPKTLDVEGHGPVTFSGANAVLELERLTRQPWERGDDRKRSSETGSCDGDRALPSTAVRGVRN